MTSANGVAKVIVVDVHVIHGVGIVLVGVSCGHVETLLTVSAFNNTHLV